MTLEEYLKTLKVGDEVQTAMHGAGFITDAGKKEVVFIAEDENTIWLEEILDDESYTRNSMYAYCSETGKQIQTMFGMFKTIQLPDWKAPNTEEE